MSDLAVPTFKKRGNKASNIRKRPATPPPEDSASESEYTDTEDGARVKRRKKDGVKVVSSKHQAAQDLSKSTTYSADRSTTISTNEDATKTSNWYDEADHAVAKPSKSPNEANDRNGGYKGSSSYSTFIEKNPDAPNRQVGPVKAPTNIRTITVTDFAPDVCKDYKQTGFCGFGDGCKFLHAREDYKQGWQLDKEWEKPGKNSKSNTAAAGADDGLDEEEKLLERVPFKCIICKGDYKTPVVTKCGHYFCERCAMTRYMKEKKRTCANCGADTGGTFAVAKKLKELLEKKRTRAQERRQKRVEAGEDVSSEDEDDG